MDLSYGIAKIELSELIRTAITAVAGEKHRLQRLYNELNNSFELKTYGEYGYTHAKSVSLEIITCSKNLHQAINVLHHLVEAEKREKLEIIRDEKKIEQKYS